MENEEFNIRNIRKNREDNLVSDVVGKIEQFLEKYSNRELLASGYDVPSDQGDRVETSMSSRYQTDLDKSSPVYILREYSECFCGCGAGSDTVWAYNNLDEDLVSRLKSEIDKNTHSLYFPPVTSKQEELMKKNCLFSIHTNRVGMDRRSWPAESNISGIDIPYDTAKNLIRKIR
jgi:hypothetical protein